MRRSLVAGLLVATLAGCSHPAPPRAASGPVTDPPAAGAWKAPAVAGASADGFCLVLTAMYRHEAELPTAKSLGARKQIVQDYIDAVPAALSAAPADIAPAAGQYLRSMAILLGDLERANLDYKRITDPQFSIALLDPAVQVAGQQIISYSQSQCHYTIGG